MAQSTERMVGYWHTPDLPEDIAKIREGWIANGPAEIRIYDRDQARTFIQEHYSARELDAFDACAIPAMQSDVFRVLEIYALGGFYLDLGIELLARPEPFLAPGDHLVLYRRWHGRIVNNMFACKAGNAILGQIKDRILDNIAQRRDGGVWGVTGPAVWNEITDTGNCAGVEVHSHEELAERIVRFRQDLSHKKDGNHWSDQEKKISIYVT